jgi:hypothetical protein
MFCSSWNKKAQWVSLWEADMLPAQVSQTPEACCRWIYALAESSTLLLWERFLVCSLGFLEAAAELRGSPTALSRFQRW